MSIGGEMKNLVHAKRLDIARQKQKDARKKVQKQMAAPKGKNAKDGGVDNDLINRPNHYQVLECPCGRSIQSRDIQQAVVNDLSGLYAVDIAKALEYILRSSKKGTELQDLQKGAKHLEWAIRGLEMKLLYAGLITEDELRHPLTTYDEW